MSNYWAAHTDRHTECIVVVAANTTAHTAMTHASAAPLSLSTLGKSAPRSGRHSYRVSHCQWDSFSIIPDSESAEWIHANARIRLTHHRQLPQREVETRTLKAIPLSCPFQRLFWPENCGTSVAAMTDGGGCIQNPVPLR